MAKAQGAFEPDAMDAASPNGAEDFAANLKRRGEAARGLEQDLISEVPLLYGSPGMAEHGDPGIVIAKLHQEELQRRNGGGALPSARMRSDASLPFERAIEALVVLIALLLLFAS